MCGRSRQGVFISLNLHPFLEIRAVVEVRRHFRITLLQRFLTWIWILTDPRMATNNVLSNCRKRTLGNQLHLSSQALNPKLIPSITNACQDPVTKLEKAMSDLLTRMTRLNDNVKKLTKENPNPDVTSKRYLASNPIKKRNGKYGSVDILHLFCWTCVCLPT